MGEIAPAAEPGDLAAMVGHREAAQAEETLESVHRRFTAGREDFMAVLDGARLVGLCARRDVGTLLGARYGFALYARAPVREHLTSEAITVRAGDRLTDVLQAVASRRDEHFYDDVLLVDGTGGFLGLIYVRDLVRRQTAMLLGNIEELRTRRDEIAAQNRQLEEDLRMGQAVQLAMLPREFPACAAPGGPALRFARRYEPAGGVGGDFFDVLPLSPSAAAIIVCDVMGHGVRAALITAMVRAVIEEMRPQATQPARLLTELNAHLTRLLQRTGDMIFVTAACGVVDAATRRLVYAQAGHPAPVHWSARADRAAPLGDADRIGGPALGLMADFDYESLEMPLGEGDRLLFFTDGISEAEDGGGEQLGVERLAEWWRARTGMPLDGAVADLEKAAGAFAGGKPFGDDLCLVACELVR